MRISDHHVEVNLSELQGYEKYVINALMNETLALSAKVGSCDHSDCRGTGKFIFWADGNRNTNLVDSCFFWFDLKLNHISIMQLKFQLEHFSL